MGQPWKPGEATTTIREMARSEKLNLAYKIHAKEQLELRGIITSDVLFVLKHGFVLTDAEPSTRDGFFRYSMENKTPNSASRDIRVVLVPDPARLTIKIVTVMWVDESAARAGTIIR